MFFREQGAERLRSLPAAWTDIEGPDPFVVLAAGRAFFRVADLRALALLLPQLIEPDCQAHSAVSVSGNMPDSRGLGGAGSDRDAR